jgi:hypothetical protein
MSESFSLLLKYPEKVPNQYPEDYPPKKKMLRIVI